MVVTVDTEQAMSEAVGFDGVVRVDVGDYYGSGVLLADGRSILTSAHLFSPSPSTTVEVSFSGLLGDERLPAKEVIRPEAHDSEGLDWDLALLTLSSAAPSWADRHSLYRDQDEVGQAFSMVGFGLQGDGLSGYDPGTGGERLAATNVFDGFSSDVAAFPSIGDEPSVLMADFDGGSSATDISPRFGQPPSTGTSTEGMLAPGDSGGPAFLGDEVAGLAAFTARLYDVDGESPDVDEVTNSSFGEVGGWTRVSYFQEWIDQEVRASYEAPPLVPDDVRMSVVEGGEGENQLTYFLVNIYGVLDDPAAPVSVDYATRDGTAVAGEDYLPVSGTLVIYPGEEQAVVPVEVLGDNEPELNETFHLDVTNPDGISLLGGVDRLSATRTIIDDDSSIA